MENNELAETFDKYNRTKNDYFLFKVDDKEKHNLFFKVESVD